MLAPLQTDVSFYFELALNRSLVSSVSHGLKTEGGKWGGIRGERAGLAVVPRPPCQLLSDALWRAHGWRFAGSHAWTSRSLHAQRGRMAAAETGLCGARHPAPFLTCLTPGLLNHTAEAQRGLVILPSSLPPCFGVTVLIFGFLTDAVKARDSPWLARRRLAVLARVLLSAAGPVSS